MEQRLRHPSDRSLRAAARASAFAVAGALTAALCQTASASPLLLNPLDLPIDAVRTTRTVSFALPAGSAQGRSGWYVIRLHLRVEFAPARGHGSAYVSAATNGRTAAQIRFLAAGRGRPVLWDAVGVIDGTQRGSIRAHAAHISFRNYLQDAGVRGGRNRLSFTVEQYGRSGLRRVVVLPSTRVVRSLPPARVLIDVEPSPEDFRPRRPFRFSVLVRNTGGRPARVVRVLADTRDPLRIALQAHRPFTLQPKQWRRLRVTARAPRAGAHEVTFTASTTANRPGTVTRLVAREPGSSTTLRMLLVASALGLGLVGLRLAGGARR